MTMSAHAEGFQDEFATIDLLLNSSCRTRVDSYRTFVRDRMGRH